MPKFYNVEYEAFVIFYFSKSVHFRTLSVHFRTLFVAT